MLFKQAQTEALYAEEKSPCIVLGTYFAKAKTNSQLFLDSRKGTWSPFSPPAEGRGGPSQQLRQLPAVPVRPEPGTFTPHPAAGHFPPSDTAQPLVCLMVVLETASTYTMAG